MVYSSDRWAGEAVLDFHTDGERDKSKTSFKEKKRQTLL